MIIIAGTIRIETEHSEAIQAAMVEMMAETMKEEGCVSYDFSADFSDPEVIHLFEEWESMDHLKAHFVAPHMGAFQEKLASLGNMERNIFKYTADGKEPL